MKLKSFCTAKKTINEIIRRSMKWKKIFANDATNKGLIPKIYKQTAHTAQYIKKKKSNKKMGRRSK